MFIHDGKVIPLAPVQDPNNIDSWGADWTDFLVEGETIYKSRWLIPSDLISLNETCTLTHTTTLLKGGVPGKSYVVTNRIVTSLGNTIDRSMFIKCVNT